MHPVMLVPEGRRRKSREEEAWEPGPGDAGWLPGPGGPSGTRLRLKGALFMFVSGHWREQRLSRAHRVTGPSFPACPGSEVTPLPGLGHRSLPCLSWPPGHVSLLPRMADAKSFQRLTGAQP